MYTKNVKMNITNKEKIAQKLQDIKEQKINVSEYTKTIIGVDVPPIRKTGGYKPIKKQTSIITPIIPTTTPTSVGVDVLAEEKGTETPTPIEGKKRNYILWGLGGLALVYFLFLRKKNS